MARIESASQAQIDAQGILETVNILKTNLSDLSFESKRQTLEALRIRIMLGKDTISIEGMLPISYGIVSSTPLRPSEYNTPQNITQTFPSVYQ